MSAIADLQDLNVWLALASPTHQHHSSAVQYWEEQASQQVLFCTVTALGLVLFVMQPKVIDISGGRTTIRNVTQAPRFDVLEKKIREEKKGW